MKNKFKKSKIIVPALALITATTAASITGTVAWFTASRAVNVAASTFVTTKLETDLSVTLTKGVGTTVTDSNATSQAVTVNGSITHGSYNAVNGASGSLYVANINDEGTAVTSYEDLGSVTSQAVESPTTSNSKWLAKADTTAANRIWYGVSWIMTFNYSKNTADTNYLMFDVNTSTFTGNSDDTTNTTGDTVNGFRIAFMTASHTLVIGGDDTLTHTTGTTSADVASYVQTGTGANYEAISATTSKLADGTTAETKTALIGSKLNLGVIDSTNGLAVTCVAWFEGSDNSIKNTYNSKDTVMSKVTSSLSFYSRYVDADLA